jgi:hypothetical protein
MNTYYSGRSSRLRGFSRSVSSTDRKGQGIKKRPAHHFAGAHRRGALYSSRRAPCEKPKGKGRVPLCERLSWQAQGGRVNTGMDGVSARLGRWENRGFGLSRFVGDIHE